MSNSILKINGQLLEQWSVADFFRSGRPRSVRTEENIVHLEASVEENAETSITQRSTQLGLSRFLHRSKSPSITSYRLQKRLEFALSFQHLYKDVSGEAHYYLIGFVNKQNCRFWGTENLRVVHERKLQPIKCDV